MCGSGGGENIFAVLICIFTYASVLKLCDVEMVITRQVVSLEVIVRFKHLDTKHVLADVVHLGEREHCVPLIFPLTSINGEEAGGT